LGVVSIIALLAALQFGSVLLSDEGPCYAGKSLNKWVLLIGRRSWEEPPSPELRRTAEHAIAHIGTNAIPFLLRWIRYDPAPSKIGKRIALVICKFPGKPHFQFLELPPKRPADEMRARGARNAFRILGATASAAIPGLSYLERSSESGEVKDRVAEAMAGIGGPALPAMINLLTNSNGSMSPLYILYAIVSLGTNAEPAIPAILDCVTNQPDILPESALRELSSWSQTIADTLEKVRKERKKRHLNPEIIYEFDDNTSVSLLVAVLSSPEPGLRAAATNALLRIAPHALTNAPPR